MQRYSTSPTVNSRLMPIAERDDPKKLTANDGYSFQGTVVVGMGFTLTPNERDDLVKRSKKNGERIFPYIGGEEVNTSPTQDFHRYVINFGDMSLEQAGRWPDLISIVRDKVKPERDKVKRDAHRKYWWHYGDKRPALYAAVDDLPRCLVTARVSKHLIMSFQPTGRVLSEQLFVFALPAYTHFAVLQSRVHEPWARLLSSSMKTDLRYAASDCFDNFPFPDRDPRAVLPPVETAGRALYEARAAYMVETDQGLTKTYNALKDPECNDPQIIELRRLHQAMDRAVLDAYGWTDIEVPPYEYLNNSFEATIIDRLFALNAQRAITPP